MGKKNAVAPAVLGVLLLLAWDVAVRFGAVDSAFLPAPAEVAKRAYEGLRDGYLATATWTTFKEAVLGASLAAAVGVPLGYALAKWRAFARTVQPYVGASQAIPAVAVAPLLTIWIGYGTLAIVFLCAIMVVFPMIVTTAAGIARVDADVLGAARLDGAHGLRLARSIELPMAAPSILAGLRTGFTLSFTGAVVGEMVTGGNGLGLTLTSAQHSADVTGMFAAIALLAVCAMFVYTFFGLFERCAGARLDGERAVQRKAKQIRPSRTIEH